MSRAKKKKLTATNADPHRLYEAAVQMVDADIDFVRRVYRKVRGRVPRRLREDFCGTAKLACEWVGRDKANEAWGIDLEPEVLQWARDHRLGLLGSSAERLHLVEGDVMKARVPASDVTVAFNFSYCVFKQRSLLKAYFESVLAGLKAQGIFVMDLFGGTEASTPLDEKSLITGRRGPDGKRIPAFTYHWQHARYNPVTSEILCYIHFKFRDGSRLRKAFTYDWRLWTIAELRDLLEEVGFPEVRVYTHGWDEDAESDGVYRHRKSFKNEDSWLAYVVGVK